MSEMIHPTAIVDPGARIGTNVEIGPYSIIGPHVEIGDNTIIGPHVVIKGHTRIGRDNHIFQFCSLGEVPQDKKYAGEPTLLEIGDRNTLREYVTMNCGTAQDVGVTRVGSDNWIMAYVHVAHDCQVGSHTIMANNTALAGMFSHASDPAVSPRFRATVCGSRSAKASESCGVPLTSGAAVQLFKSLRSPLPGVNADMFVSSPLLEKVSVPAMSSPAPSLPCAAALPSAAGSMATTNSTTFCPFAPGAASKYTVRSRAVPWLSYTRRGCL